MPVTEVLEALGSFEFELLGNVHRDVLDAIEYFGHVAIVPGRMDPRLYGDGTLDAARYVGVVRRIKIADDGRTNLIQDDIRLGGVGMNFWLGDDDDKGYVLESPKEFNSASFVNIMSAAPTGLRPASVGAGNISASVSGSYTGRHEWETPRTSIGFVCETMSTDDQKLSFKVNNRGNLDAGLESELFITTPKCIMMRKGTSAGEDMTLRAIPGTIDMDQDMEDFSTRVVMIAEADSESLATGSADIDTIAPGVNVFKDIHGNALKLTRLVSEADTIEGLADTRAEIALRKVITQHRTLTLATEEYDIYGSFNVGDYIWVYDPDAGLVDDDNEVYIRGIRINPVKLQVTECEWPITDDYTVGYRTNNGVWYDLTDWMHFDDEATTKITIGDFERMLNDDRESVRSRVASYIPPDSSTPNAPVLTVGATEAYLDSNGFAKAVQTLSWTVPTNTDSSVIVDGDRYEINIRRNGDTDWTSYNFGWGTNSTRLTDLAVGTQYQARVRASDVSNNTSAWSSTQNFTTSVDNLAPSTPAAPTVAASTIAVQVKHTLGKASGGTYNLEADLAELEVHKGTSSGFTPSASGTYIGSIRANQGMMLAQVPAVETLAVADTSQVFIKVIAVDTSGNKSAASSAASVTATLVDSAHISDLTVTKVTAGTISSAWLIGANIHTAVSGARVVLNNNGIQAYSSGGTQTVTINAADGSVDIIGQFRSGPSGKRLVVSPSGATTPQIQFYPTTGSEYALISAYENSSIPGTVAALLVRSSPSPSGGASPSGVNSLVALDHEVAIFGRWKFNSGDGLYYANGGYTKAEYDRVRTAWFSGFGGNFGGSFMAKEDLAEVGWFGASSGNWNSMLFDEDGITRHYGKWYNEAQAQGNASIIPVADTPTSGTVTGFGTVAGTSFYGFVSAQTTAIGSTVKGVAQSGVTATSITIWVYRTNTVTTNVDWMIIGGA